KAANSRQRYRHPTRSKRALEFLQRQLRSALLKQNLSQVAVCERTLRRQFDGLLKIIVGVLEVSSSWFGFVKETEPIESIPIAASLLLGQLSHLAALGSVAVHLENPGERDKH